MLEKTQLSVNSLTSYGEKRMHIHNGSVTRGYVTAKSLHMKQRNCEHASSGGVLYRKRVSPLAHA